MTSVGGGSAYPEYEQVAAAAAAMPSTVNPAELAVMEEVACRRGPDWCTTVIGRPYSGLEYTPLRDARMLVVADELGLDPPPPAWLIREQAGIAIRDAVAATRDAVPAARQPADRRSTVT